MKILVIEPFYTESHKKWLDGLVKYSTHEIETLTLSGFHWKWRMHGAAVTLAKRFLKSHSTPDLILCTDMLDVNVFIGLTRHNIKNIPIGIFFHENQISYPWSPKDQDVKLGRDRHYGFINYTSALAADRVFFNSNYHQESFLTGLKVFLSEFPDHQNLETIDQIKAKSQVLHLGLELHHFDAYLSSIKSSAENNLPTLLWNHRWEFDKNPDLFFETLFRFKREGLRFQLILLGKEYPSKPSIFEEAKQQLKEEIIHYGYAPSFEEYASLLARADILPVTSHQDFFGIAVVEAIYCGAVPLLPRRLAFPEHIDDPSLFYENDQEFYEKLKSLLVGYPSKDNIDLSKISAYDWSKQILKYDDAFYRLSANFKSNSTNS